MRLFRESIGLIFSVAPADALALLGLILLGTGLWLIDPPLALVVIGALLLVAVSIHTLRGSRQESQQ